MRTRSVLFLALPALLAGCQVAAPFDTASSGVPTAQGDSGSATDTGGGANISAANGDRTNGAPLYAGYCSGCHGSNAQGGAGPALVGMPFSTTIINDILYGNNGMPAFSSYLSDSDLSDILAYIDSL